MKLFISYSWKDFEMAEQIDSDFLDLGIKLVRDIRDVEYGSSFSKFMHDIRYSDFVIMFISDNYLKSLNCMTEVLETIKEIDYQKRVFHVISDTLDINSIKKRIEYTKYWENRYNEVEKEIKDLREANKSAYVDELKKCKIIELEIGNFLKNIIDHKYLNYSDIKKDCYLPILELIDPNNIDKYKELTKIKRISNSSFRLDKLKELKIKIPDWPYVYFALGVDELQQHNYNDAINYFDYAIKLDTYNIPSYLNKGFALGFKNQLYEAIKCYDIIISLNDKIIDAYYNRANAYMLIENFEDAINDYSRCIEMNPYDHEALNNRALVFIRMSLFKEAIEDLNKAIVIFPQKAKAYNNMGIAHKKLNMYYNALRDYNYAIEIDRNYSDAYFNRALVKNRLNDKIGAENDLQKAKELGNQNAMKIIGFIY